MPVEERLRIAFAANATEVRPDVEQRLGAVHRRRTRRRVALAASLVAAVSAVAAGVGLLVPDHTPTPPPAGPTVERFSEPGETIPLGTFVRRVTTAEAAAAGFGRQDLRYLFGGGPTARVELRFREDPDGTLGPENGWSLTFVDEAGHRHTRDAGGFFYGEAGELTMSSRSFECNACTAHYAWDLSSGQRLTLEVLPTTTTPEVPTVQLLQSGTWVRRQG